MGFVISLQLARDIDITNLWVEGDLNIVVDFLNNGCLIRMYAPLIAHERSL